MADTDAARILDVKIGFQAVAEDQNAQNANIETRAVNASSIWPNGAVKTRDERSQYVFDVRDYASFDPTGANDSRSAIAAAVAAAGGNTLRIPGQPVVSGDPINIPSPITIIGSSERFGTIIKGVGGNKTYRGKRIHPDDGLDPLRSAIFTINAGNVHFDRIELRSDDDTYDCAVILNGQPRFTTEFCKIGTGRFMFAGLYNDWSRDNGNCDQQTHIGTTFQGFWGVATLGPLPKSGETALLPGDLRGAGGCSSGAWFNTVFQSLDPVGGRRNSDTDGGCLWMDGLCPTPFGRMNDNSFYGVRMVTAEPFAYKIGACSDAKFYGVHAERLTGILNADGSPSAGSAGVKGQTTSAAQIIQFYGGVHGNMTKDRAPGTVTTSINEVDVGSSAWSVAPPSIAGQEAAGIPATLPRLRGSTGQLSAGSPYTVQNCYASKIGGRVDVWIQFDMADITGLSGNITIDQLPYTRLAGTGPQMAFPVIVGSVDTGTDAAPIVCTLNAGQSAISLLKQRDAAALTNVTSADLVNTSRFFIHLTYPVAP